VKVSEKLTKNSRKNKKNELTRIMCNNKGKHTDEYEYGWTTIDVNSNFKPKTKNSKQTAIVSIIATINIDTKTVRKGAPEAKIDPPERENRCNKLNENKKQMLSPSTGEEKEREKKENTSDKTRIIVLNKNKECEKDRNTTSEGTRSNKARVETRKGKKKGHGRKLETTIASKREENEEAGEQLEIGKRSSEEKQNEANKEADNQKPKIN
jgi:hypothetical protein